MALVCELMRIIGCSPFYLFPPMNQPHFHFSAGRLIYYLPIPSLPPTTTTALGLEIGTLLLLLLLLLLLFSLLLLLCDHPMPWKKMSVVSFLWLHLSSSFAVLDPQDHKAVWLFKFSATVVVGIAVAAFVWRRTKGRVEYTNEVDTGEDSELTCFCGLPAKLRISRTSKNPYRLFYNCPKNVHCHQCRYFCWSGENSTSLERYLEEKKILRGECIRLQKRIDYVQSRRRQEKSAWGRVRADLISRLSTAQSELDDIKKKIQEVNESEEMPPVDESCRVDEEEEDGIGVVVLTTVE